MAKMKMDKDPWEVVPEEFKDAVNGESVDDIKKRVAKVALDQCELMAVKKQDQDLAEKHEQFKEASMMYREGTKANKKKIEYCRMMIESKGGK